MKKILYAFSIGFFGACGYAIVNMLVAPKADPVIGLSFFAVIFVVCFIFALFDYDKKIKKKAEEEKRQAYEKCPNGIIGLETMIPLIYTNFIR